MIDIHIIKYGSLIFEKGGSNVSRLQQSECLFPSNAFENNQVPPYRSATWLHPF